MEDQDATYAYKKAADFKISRRKPAEQKIGNLLKVCAPEAMREMWSARVKATSTILARAHSHAIKQGKTNGI